MPVISHLRLRFRFAHCRCTRVTPRADPSNPQIPTYPASQLCVHGGERPRRLVRRQRYAIVRTVGSVRLVACRAGACASERRVVRSSLGRPEAGRCASARTRTPWSIMNCFLGASGPDGVHAPKGRCRTEAGDDVGAKQSRCGAPDRSEPPSNTRLSIIVLNSAFSKRPS